jgi:hypothetical protein
LLATILTLVIALLSTPVHATAATHSAHVDLQDGTYLVPVTLEGGTGRASIASPASVTVEDGKATTTIVWSSPNYDYMIVDGQHFLPTNEEGNSTFEIPLPSLDEPLDVVADTTAMSQPHEIRYRMTFDVSDATKTNASFDVHLPPVPLLVVAGIATAALAVPISLGVARALRK